MTTTKSKKINESRFKIFNFYQQITYGIIGIMITIGFSQRMISAQTLGTILDGIIYNRFFNGSCNQFLVGNATYKCKFMSFTAFKNGRMAFSVGTGNGVLMFAGGKDSQLDSTRYTLLVDRIRFADGNIQTQYDADGKCEMLVSSDGMYVHEVKCRVTNGVEQIKIDFLGDGSPVSE